MEVGLGIEQSNDCLYLIQKEGKTKVFHDFNGEMGEGVVMLGGQPVIL